MTEKQQLVWGYLAAFATLLMWAGFSLISRLGGKSVLTPYDIFALRLITASVILLPFAGSMPARAWSDRRLWLLTFLCSLIYCPLAYTGFKYAPAAHGAILLSGMQPFLISAVVWLLVGTRPTRIRSIGLGLIGTGIVCAAYRIVMQGWTPEKALEELMDERFGHHRSYYSNLAELVRDTDWKAFKEEFRRKRQAQGV